MANVLLIDDDRMPMIYYVHALEAANFTVDHVCMVDDAIERIRNTELKYCAIVLDIMMKPGKKFATARESDRGLRSGLLLYREAVLLRPETPILVLTNVGNSATLELFPPDAEIWQKLDVSPQELVEIVRDKLNLAAQPLEQ